MEKFYSGSNPKQIRVYDNPATRQAGLIRPLTAGSESHPFSSRDLYGTDDDRLHSISRCLRDLATDLIRRREHRVALDLLASALHFERLAMRMRGDRA